MRARLATAVVLVAAVSAAAPSSAAKPKPKPFSGGYAATATPDPTSDVPAPAGHAKCDPKTPTAKVKHVFTAPAKGTLVVQLNNKLDWSGDIRDSAGAVLGDTDGDLPNTPETMTVSFTKKTTIVIGTCNFSGEPTIKVTYTFTYR